MYFDDRADTGTRRKNRFQSLEVAIPWLNDFPAAMEANNLRSAGECAKHQDDSFVFFQVSDRFHTATGQVEISNRLFVDDSEGFAIFRRTVHVTFSRKRGGRHKKHLLCRKPISHFFVDRFVNFAHSESRDQKSATSA